MGPQNPLHLNLGADQGVSNAAETEDHEREGGAAPHPNPRTSFRKSFQSQGLSLKDSFCLVKGYLMASGAMVAVPMIASAPGRGAPSTVEEGRHHPSLSMSLSKPKNILGANKKHKINTLYSRHCHESAPRTPAAIHYPLKTPRSSAPPLPTPTPDNEQPMPVQEAKEAPSLRQAPAEPEAFLRSFFPLRQFKK